MTLFFSSANWEAHLRILAAGPTLTPSKVQVGPKDVKYLGYVLSANGISIGNDRIKAIVDLTT